MVDTPSSEPKSGPAQGPGLEPFKRGRITWSRPPQPIFRVGPPPRGSGPLPTQGQRPVAQVPLRQNGVGILSGSMIPRAVLPSTPAKARIESAALPTSRPEAGPASVLPPIEPPAPARLDSVVGAIETPRLPEPSLTPRLNTEATVPRIETAPLSVAPVSSPPTAVEAPATDADAPIRTQSLN